MGGGCTQVSRPANQRNRRARRRPACSHHKSSCTPLIVSGY